MKLKIALLCCGSACRHEQEQPYLDGGGIGLSRFGQDKLAGKAAGYPEAALVYTGDSICCHESAAIAYSRTPAVITKNLRPYDFGQFAGKTRQELHKDARYEQWLQSAKAEACPGGENPYQFQARCIQAFRAITAEMGAKGFESTAIIAHNAVISTILERYIIPRTGYHNWDISGGNGYFIEYDSLHFTAKINSLL